MKLTKSQLKRIIKEELERVIEVDLHGYGPGEQFAKYDSLKAYALAMFKGLVNAKRFSGRGGTTGYVSRRSSDPLAGGVRWSEPAIDGLVFDDWYEKNKKEIERQAAVEGVLQRSRAQTARSREMVRKHGVGDPEWDITTDPDAPVWEHKNKS